MISLHQFLIKIVTYFSEGSIENPQIKLFLMQSQYSGTTVPPDWSKHGCQIVMNIKRVRNHKREDMVGIQVLILIEFEPMRVKPIEIIYCMHC